MDRVTQVEEAIEAAGANGWEFLGIMSGSVVKIRRMTEQVTPQFALDNGWWNSSTYTAVQILSFLFTSRTRAPKVVHGTNGSPWTGGQHRNISFKAALALLSQPLDESELHNRD